MVLVRKEKDWSPKFTQLSSAEIVEDQPVAIWNVWTYCHEQNLSSKIRVHKPNIAWYVVFKPLFANAWDNFC